MGGQAGGAAAFEMPERQIVQPDLAAVLPGFEAEIGILVMAEDVFLREAAEAFEPGAVRGDQRAGDGGDLAGVAQGGVIGGRTLAVMFHTQRGAGG